MIQKSTRDAFRDAKVTVVWERVLPGDGTEAQWWHGLGVFFVEAPPGEK